MNKLIYRLPLQYFAEEVASADDVDFGAAFASDSEGSGESEPQETSVETTGGNVEKVEVANQQTETEEIPNEGIIEIDCISHGDNVWSKS